MKIRMAKPFSFLFLVFLLWPFSAFSFSYQPQSTIYIKTQILSSSGETPDSEARTWRVASGSVPQAAAARVSFFSENASNPFCHIKLSAAGQILDSELPGAAGNVLQKPGVLFVPGYPAPCDIFPHSMLFPDTPEAAATFQVQRDIGGQKFVDEICIQTSPVSVAEARANGWLHESTQNLPDALRVLKAVNCRSGRLISLQLWPASGDWWIYEETPYRRSWQIKNVND